MLERWRGVGPSYHITWGGREWTLRLDGPRPCLRSDRDQEGPLLGLEGVAEVGRWAPSALGGANLLEHECRQGRVVATYAPLGWGSLKVRASWSPAPEEGMDLEVQISARSVGLLRAVEVLVVSGLAGPKPGASRFVEPRDGFAAGLSYDGREPDVSCLTTLPPRDLGPLLSRSASWGRAEGLPDYYAEFAHPRDVARRITWGGRSARASRYGLFGHDLERGVVLRGRIRGHWLMESAAGGARDLHRRFLEEPPSLST